MRRKNETQMTQEIKEIKDVRIKEVKKVILETIKKFSPIGRNKKGKNKNAYSLRELRDLFLNKRLVPADIQRWYRTKHGNAICLSVMFGRGTMPALINLKNNVYYIFDGAQRLISVMLYITGMTKDDLANNGLLTESGVKANRSMILSMKNEKQFSFLPSEARLLFKQVFEGKKFTELDETLQDWLLDNIYLDMSVLCDLSDEDMLSVYCDYNSGNTKLTKFEIAKAKMNMYLWKKIREVSKEFVGCFKEASMAQEKLVSELFCMYLNFTAGTFKNHIIDNNTMLADAVCELVESNLSNEQIDKHIEGFRKIFTEFRNSGFFNLSSVRSDNNAFDLRNIFYFYMKNYVSCVTDGDAIIAKLNEFLTSDKIMEIKAKESDGSTYYTMSKNGTNHISNLKNACQIFDAITSDFNIVLVEFKGEEKMESVEA